MTTHAEVTTDDDVVIGNDDYALTRVPQEARYSWVNVAVQRFGQLSALAQFFLAASIGVGMSFWNAMLAITIGSVLLEIVTIFVGIAGMKEGLSTSVLARWTGFGRYGSAIVGIAMAVSLLGWFGIQNAVFAEGLAQIINVPFPILALVGGIVVTLVVMFGFKHMGWVAYVSVPAFLLLCIWSVGTELQKHSLSDLMSSAPAGTPISLAAGTTIVAGGFIVGAVMTPDMTRFNRSVGDVVKQTIVGVTLGEYFVGVIGVLLAHAVKASTANDAGLVIGIIQSTTGTVGILILITSIIKINAWNLYPSSLGLTNAMHTLFGLRLNRVYIAVALGVVGSILSAAGFAGFFQNFLMTLGVVFPPIAGIMIVDYFILKTWRSELEATRESGGLPTVVQNYNIAGIIAWVVGAVIGYKVALGIPAVNAILVTMVLYYALGKFGLARTGEHSTADDEDMKPTPVG